MSSASHSTREGSATLLALNLQNYPSALTGIKNKEREELFDSSASCPDAEVLLKPFTPHLTPSAAKQKILAAATSVK